MLELVIFYYGTYEIVNLLCSWVTDVVMQEFYAVFTLLLKLLKVSLINSNIAWKLDTTQCCQVMINFTSI